MLMEKRFGFLGAGVIAEVFIRRFLKSGLARPEDILASGINSPILDRLAITFHVRAMKSNREVAAGSDFVFLEQEARLGPVGLSIGMAGQRAAARGVESC